MKLDVWCRTDRGLRRETNQDSFLINPDLGLYIVADGMGGHSGGEVASSMAVKSAEELILEKRKLIPSPRDLLKRAYEEASERIYHRANHENPELSGMGTTMVVAYLAGSSLFIGNVGDSRAYLHRAPFLWQVTEDHSLINEQIRNGSITPEQAKTTQGRNVITRSVGYEKEVNVDVLERPLQSGDCVLICSDGLSGLVEDFEIAQILNRYQGQAAIDKLVDKALEHGGDDNVTVMLVKVS